MAADNKSILPAGYFGPKPKCHTVEAINKPDGIHCGNCDARLGENMNGSLGAEQFTVANRVVVRCRRCKTKNEFKPERYKRVG